MNQRPDQMLAEGKLAPAMYPLDAFRILRPDAVVQGAFWYFTREPHPATGPAAMFRLAGYIPPAGKAKP